MIINLVGFFRVPKVAPKMHQPPFLRTSTGVFFAQRKKSVDLHFLHHRHKAGGASPLGVACAACFEELAGVFASSGALHYAKIFASQNIKNDCQSILGWI